MSQVVIYPKKLTPGDVVSVIAPSGIVPREAFEAGVGILQSRYKVRYDPDLIFAKDGFLAGSDEQRLAALASALTDDTSCAVFMARGGYGLTRLLPFITDDLFLQKPKPIVGFSDGTALLAAASRARLASIHGPTITQLSQLESEDHRALFRLLETPEPQVLLEGLSCEVPGKITGPLLGGNLQVFSRLLGTPYMPDLTGAVLFLEDVSEPPYKIDRLITHLDSAGIFSAVSAVIIGDFVRCQQKDPSGTEISANEVLQERLGRLAIPVAFGAPFGHGSRNRSLPYGTLVELDTRKETLTAINAAVS